MEMAKSSPDLRTWALLGAQHRLKELDEERAAIFSAFPQLRRQDGEKQQRTSRSQSNGDIAQPAPGRRQLSPEARRRISEAVKARWAKQKAAAASATKAANKRK